MTAVAKIEETNPVVAAQSSSLLAIIERGSRDPSVDIDKMERLMAMYERIQEREAKAVFADALATMQPLLPKISERGRIIVREMVNGKRTGDIQQETPFALWEDINEAIRPHLAEHGFALMFRTGLSPDGRVTVTAVLSHRAGHSEETTMILPHDSSGSKNAVQAIGSSTSYGKRYTALALLNITTGGEDDDGLGAVSVQVHEKPSDAPFPQGPAQNKTALKQMGRAFWRDVESCGDMDTLDALLASHGPLLAQLKKALPSWWDGGEKDGNSFEGLGEVITRQQRDLADV